MSGSINVITGPMKSRKTFDLIARGLDAFHARKKWIALRPEGSDRNWDEQNEIVSRLSSLKDAQGNIVSENIGAIHIPASIVKRDLSDVDQILPLDIEVVLIDEAQFFSHEIVHFVSNLRDEGVDVYISGLDMDCFRQPYSQIPYLMAMADTVTKKTSICERCGDIAAYTFRFTKETDQDVVGDTQYAAVCLDCYLYYKEGVNAHLLEDIYESPEIITDNIEPM